MTRSTDECEMSRSCQSAMFSIAAIALPRSSRARPQICSQPIGLRLCGIADEPFWPLRERLLDLADFGLLQPANLERELLERRAGDGQRRHQLRVPIALDDLRRHRRRLQPEPAADVGLDRRRQVGEGADRARNLADARRPRARGAGASMSRCSSAYHSASFRPNVIGSACTPCVRPIIGVCRCSSARVADGLGQRLEVLQDQVARLDHLQRQRGVDDVGRRQAEMQLARRRPDVLGHGRRERDDVVMRRLLDFLDARDVERARAAELACGVGGTMPASAIASAAASSTSSHA